MKCQRPMLLQKYNCTSANEALCSVHSEIIDFYFLKSIILLKSPVRLIKLINVANRRALINWQLGALPLSLLASFRRQAFTYLDTYRCKRLKYKLLGGQDNLQLHHRIWLLIYRQSPFLNNAQKIK